MTVLREAILQDGTAAAYEPAPADAAEATPVPAGAWTPRQLPPDIAGFVGRAADLAVLDELVDETIDARVVTAAVDGPAGIGKTALVVHWAHRVSGHFPDGQLYVNLHGYGTEKPVETAGALDFMLRSLGVPAARIPPDLDARSALLRSELAGRRLLVILDNARDSEQVRPLLPGSGSLALITGRRQLRSLAVREGARRITLGLLDDMDAVALLHRVLGAERVRHDPAAAVEVVDLCARLPLALRVVAEYAARRLDEPLAEVAADLRAQRSRLDALSADDGVSTDLRAVFSWSYNALSDSAARMFRLLGLSPGTEFSACAAAALAGLVCSAGQPAAGRVDRRSPAGEPDARPLRVPRPAR
ncbi:NB-ARC domain-containing protein [Fodinicola feengrottensis]|uniref:NB-ARC domain-containing protein n=1 Tax=Fodinicola feengrottensis TaxID=435914 RepID=UPI0013D10A98|nr:NB-ARC domain-containing protein [Fodinicola feengrottensis]